LPVADTTPGAPMKRSLWQGANFFARRPTWDRSSAPTVLGGAERDEVEPAWRARPAPDSTLRRGGNLPRR